MAERALSFSERRRCPCTSYTWPSFPIFPSPLLWPQASRQGTCTTGVHHDGGCERALTPAQVVRVDGVGQASHKGLELGALRPTAGECRRTECQRYGQARSGTHTVRAAKSKSALHRQHNDAPGWCFFVPRHSCLMSVVLNLLWWARKWGNDRAVPNRRRLINWEVSGYAACAT